MKNTRSIDDRNKLLLKYPASWWGAAWRDALPSGNGLIGASVYGAVHNETIMITHTDLWSGGKTPNLPNVSDTLSVVREYLLNNEPRKADPIMKKALVEKGYAPQIASPLPLGDLFLTMPTHQAFKQYQRQLNMETGEVSVSWLDGDIQFQRRLFVSRSDDLIVYHVQADKAGYLDAVVSFGKRGNRDFQISKRAQTISPEQVSVTCEGEYIYYAATNDDGTDYGAVVRVITASSEVSIQNEAIHLSHEDEVLVLVLPFIKGNRTLDWKMCKDKLSTIDLSYEALLERHVKEHYTLFSRVSMDLFGDEHHLSNEELLLKAYQGEAPISLVEKMWAYGRYLLISSSRENGQPCHLYGLWCGQFQEMWAFNMANENLQMIYWQALSGNMPELLLPVFDYFERLLDDFKTNAQQLFGCRGIYVPGPTAPDSGLIKTLSPHIIYWTGGAGWVAQHFYDYYLYTGDQVFLRERALPFLREVALFYEDFFIEGTDGYYISCPSNSPENSPGNYWDGRGMGQAMETTINATMDFAIAKEVLTNLIEGAEILQVYSEEISKWKEMFSKIPPYQINEDGAVKEWMHPFFTDNYHHRHQSHIYPVFPGTEVTRMNQPELFEAFVTAVKKRLVIGLNQQTGWSLAHMSNNYARMGEGDLALECLDSMSRSCLFNNFFTSHNDWRKMGIGVDQPWAPFQIDANSGWTAAIQEMLIFSVPGVLYILPAIPSRMKQGKCTGLLAKGGIEVNLTWDLGQGHVECELYSLNEDQTIRVVPFGLKDGESFLEKAIDVKLVKGKKKQLTISNQAYLAVQKF